MGFPEILEVDALVTFYRDQIIILFLVVPDEEVFGVPLRIGKIDGLQSSILYTAGCSVISNGML